VLQGQEKATKGGSRLNVDDVCDVKVAEAEIVPEALVGVHGVRCDEQLKVVPEREGHGTREGCGGRSVLWTRGGRSPTRRGVTLTHEEDVMGTKHARCRGAYGSRRRVGGATMCVRLKSTGAAERRVQCQAQGIWAEADMHVEVGDEGDQGAT